MTPSNYSGRPSSRPHKIYVVFGIEATRAYSGGERDPEVLNRVGKLREYVFDTLKEMNAFIQGVEDATGYLDSMLIEQE